MNTFFRQVEQGASKQRTGKYLAWWLGWVCICLSNVVYSHINEWVDWDDHRHPHNGWVYSHNGWHPVNDLEPLKLEDDQCELLATKSDTDCSIKFTFDNNWRFGNFGKILAGVIGDPLHFTINPLWGASISLDTSTQQMRDMNYVTKKIIFPNVSHNSPGRFFAVKDSFGDYYAFKTRAFNDQFKWESPANNDATERYWQYCNRRDSFSSRNGCTAARDSDFDTSLSNGVSLSEPIIFPMTIITATGAIDLLDFTITDGGSNDGLTTNIRIIVLDTSGTGDFSKVTWRLKGNDASDIVGIYNSAANTIIFSDLDISVADGSSETYTINGYFNNTIGISNNSVYILSINSDGIILDRLKTNMGMFSTVSNGIGAKATIITTKNSIPTLSEWVQYLLVVLLAIAGMRRNRQKKHP